MYSILRLAPTLLSALSGVALAQDGETAGEVAKEGTTQSPTLLFDAAGEFVLENEAGLLVLAAGALGTAAYGLVDALKPLFSASGRGRHFASACPLEWSIYVTLLAPNGQVSEGRLRRPLERRISAQLKSDPEAVIDDMHQVLMDWLDYGDPVRLGSERLRRFKRSGIDANAMLSKPEDASADTTQTQTLNPEALAKALGWSSYATHQEKLKTLEQKETLDDDQERLELTQAMGARAAALRNLERRLRLGVEASEARYSHNHRSIAMVVSVIMACVAAVMSGVTDELDQWLVYLGIGLVAVPLAPVSRQLADALGQLSKATVDLVDTVSKRRRDTDS